MMMKWLTSFLLLLTISFTTSAQMKGSNSRMEKIEAARKVWITQKLDLTDDEAKSFWPVYDSYQKEIEGIFRQKRQAKANAATIPYDELTFDTRILETRKKYRQEFIKILPKNKVIRLNQAEKEFRDQLIKHLNAKG